MMLLNSLSIIKIWILIKTSKKKAQLHPKFENFCIVQTKFRVEFHTDREREREREEKRRGRGRIEGSNLGETLYV